MRKISDWSRLVRGLSGKSRDLRWKLDHSIPTVKRRLGHFRGDDKKQGFTRPQQ